MKENGNKSCIKNCSRGCCISVWQRLAKMPSPPYLVFCSHVACCSPPPLAVLTLDKNCSYVGGFPCGRDYLPPCRPATLLPAWSHPLLTFVLARPARRASKENLIKAQINFAYNPHCYPPIPFTFSAFPLSLPLSSPFCFCCS